MVSEEFDPNRGGPKRHEWATFIKWRRGAEWKTHEKLAYARNSITQNQFPQIGGYENWINNNPDDFPDRVVYHWEEDKWVEYERYPAKYGWEIDDGE